MALADRASRPVIVQYQNMDVAITCHVATFFWAALEARGHHGGIIANGLQILQNITGAGNLYAILAGLPSAGTWDFRITPTTPPRGTVLLWVGDTNHSAVVIQKNLIAGHNQGHQFDDVASPAYCMKHVQKVNATTSVVRLIAEASVVNKAAQLNL